MRLRWQEFACLAMGAFTVAAATAATAASPVDAGAAQSLRERLLSITEERLQSAGLFVDRQSAWISLSSPLSADDEFDVQPRWIADATHFPSLPLTFELQPRSRSEFAARETHKKDTINGSIKVTLAVSLQREVWIATRRLHKGSAVTCADLSLQRRPARDLSPALLSPCNVEPQAVALRDIAAGDVMRTLDVGRAPDVAAGAQVQVRVASGGIEVIVAAIALGDARVGDRIDVRLQRPTRTLRTRVIAPGTVQLADRSR